MNLKNKIIAGALCALIAGIGIFGAQINVARGENATLQTVSATLLVEQIQQAVSSVQQQVAQLLETSDQIALPISDLVSPSLIKPEIKAEAKPNNQTTCRSEGQLIWPDEPNANCCLGLTKTNLTTVPYVNCATAYASVGGVPAICARCGDKFCGSGEDNCNCPQDCDNSGNKSCGDLVCDPKKGETKINCPTDCDKTRTVCGNGRCEYMFGENPFSCRKDCPPTISWDKQTARPLLGKIQVAVIITDLEEPITTTSGGNTISPNMTYSGNTTPAIEITAAPPLDIETIKRSVKNAEDFLAYNAPAQANLSFKTVYYSAKLSKDYYSDCGEDKVCGSHDQAISEEIAKKLGYSSFDDFTNHLKKDNGANASVVIVELKTAYAKMNHAGGSLVMMSTQGLQFNYVVTAHEMLHTFGATDENEKNACSGNYMNTFYNWDYPNGNCWTGGMKYKEGKCLMINQMFGLNATLCDSTRGQIGWGDHDNDGRLDPVDSDMYVAQYPKLIITPKPKPAAPDCKSSRSQNLSPGENNIIFETPHPYANDMECVSGIYSCPKGYYAMPHFRFEGDVNDEFQVYNKNVNEPGKYAYDIGKYVSAEYNYWPLDSFGIDPKTQNDTFKMQFKFSSDGFLTGWGLKVDKINCYLPK